MHAHLLKKENCLTVCLEAVNLSHFISSRRNCNVLTFIFYLNNIPYHLSFHFEIVAVLWYMDMVRNAMWHECFIGMNYVRNFCIVILLIVIWEIWMEIFGNIFQANFDDWWLWYLLRNCLRWMGSDLTNGTLVTNCLCAHSSVIVVFIWINTNITLSWAPKQFFTWVHTLFHIYLNVTINRQWHIDISYTVQGLKFNTFRFWILTALILRR